MKSGFHPLRLAVAGFEPVGGGQVTAHFSASLALGIAAGGLVVSALPISHVEKLDLSPSIY